MGDSIHLCPKRDAGASVLDAIGKEGFKHRWVFNAQHKHTLTLQSHHSTHH